MWKKVLWVNCFCLGFIPKQLAGPAIQNPVNFFQLSKTHTVEQQHAVAFKKN